MTLPKQRLPLRPKPMASPKILRLALDALHLSGLPNLVRPQLRGAGVIFCLHHVLPGGGRQTGFAPNSKLECEPAFLEGIIKLVRERGYQTLSLGEAVERLTARQRYESPFAVFTLDDGYKDNAEFAQPIFQASKCPYTIFVAPRIADGTAEIWWRNLEHIIASNSRLRCVIAGQSFDLSCHTEAEKWQTWKTLYPLFENLDQFEQRTEIRKMATNNGEDVDTYCRRVAMNWNELNDIARDPLCELGAHTVNHHSVGRMSAADALTQLSASRQLMAKHLGKLPRFNAYPYGDRLNATARDFKMAAEAGYQASLTTRKGVVFAEHASHIQALPRIMVSGRYQELHYIDTLISGLPTALANRFRHLNIS